MHRPQPEHSPNTEGTLNPSLSRTIVIASLGHIMEHNPQPVQQSLRITLEMLGILLNFFCEDSRVNTICIR